MCQATDLLRTTAKTICEAHLLKYTIITHTKPSLFGKVHDQLIKSSRSTYKKTYKNCPSLRKTACGALSTDTQAISPENREHEKPFA